MRKLVKLVKLNNLQYNPNRDPQAFRRTPGQEFRIQALLDGSGAATARLEVDGRTVCEQTLSLPGEFDCRLAFDSPGMRVGKLVVEGNGETYQQNLPLDVEAHAWAG